MPSQPPIARPDETSPEGPSAPGPGARSLIRARGLLELLVPEGPGLEMQMVGRALLHAALVGLLAGLLGAVFFTALEWTQHLLLERGAGLTLLRAAGENGTPDLETRIFRPWMVVVLPALGALLAGWVMRRTPITRGGGGNAMIEEFHHGVDDAPGRPTPWRVLWVKGLASVLTLGSGGAGGREGPTMQMGGAIGLLVGRLLHLDRRERRLLLVAGVAAGIAAVFRTPLGAALLAIEVLYRDDFESEALVPAILASVVSYSVVILIHGEHTLFGVTRHFPFTPVHLPLYVLMAVGVAALAALFQSTLERVKRGIGRLPVPEWVRPGIGGLGVGLLTLPLLLYVGTQVGHEGQSLGILGGGYGAAQAAIDGSALVPEGWGGAELLLLLCVVKLLASSSTIGSGGSAGDFAPSLVLGALLGGAFGRAAQELFHDPSIDPGAFALVGMGTFYGGIAHVPVAALVLTCELAGSYDLLVPLMLAGGVAFLLLRHRTLYEAQVATRRESPVHRRTLGLALLAGRRVADVLKPPSAWLTVLKSTRADELMARLPAAAGQDVIPVLDGDGRLVGLVLAETVRFLAVNPEAQPFTIVEDIAQPPVSVGPDDDLHAAAAAMLAADLAEIPVVDAQGRVVGRLTESDLFGAYLAAAATA